LESLDLSGWDTSSLAYMSGMFSECNALETLNYDGWDTSSVMIMSYMFQYCKALVELDLSGFDTSSVTDMRNMFFGREALEELDLSGFDTSSVTDMVKMFFLSSNLTTIYASDKWSTAKVTSSSQMFSNCTSLPNFNSSVIDKTNAHYGAGGYLTYKAAPAV
jgi:surface protein